MTQLLHVSARNLTGDPAPVAPSAAKGGRRMRLAGRRRDLAVQRHRRFQRDQRRLVANVFCESFIQRSCFVFQNA